MSTLRKSTVCSCSQRSLAVTIRLISVTAWQLKGTCDVNINTLVTIKTRKLSQSSNPCHTAVNPNLDPLSTPKPYHFQDIPRSLHIPNLNTLDLSFLSYLSGQTNRQTDLNTLPTLTKGVGMGNQIGHSDSAYLHQQRKFLYVKKYTILQCTESEK